MPTPPVDPVDVGLLAASRSASARAYRLADFVRLGESLAQRAGLAEAEFRFRVLDCPSRVATDASTASALPVLEGSVRARPWLVCQRCLNAYQQPLQSELRIAFVATDADAASVPDGYEAVAAPHGRASLAELVEDELLLALPLVPMHATAAECTARLQEAAVPQEIAPREGTQRPFAGLRALLGEQGSNEIQE